MGTDTENLCEYGRKGEGNIARRSEKKEKACDGYVWMYECGKNLLRSMYERACKIHRTTISQTKETVDIIKF